MLYGEPLFVAAVADQLGLTLLEPPFEWLATVPRDFTRRDIACITFAEAARLRERRFVKPADDKVFPAQVYPDGRALPGHVPPDTPVLASAPVEWEAEFRTFVLDGAPVTLSPYWRGGSSVQRAWHVDQS